MPKSRYDYAKRAPKAARTGPDGFVYDSKTEMRRGIDLQLLERAGEIKELQRQVKYPLVSGCSRCGNVIAIHNGKYDDAAPIDENTAAHYTPDFVYVENGRIVVEDVKGYADEVSKLRIRIFEAFYKQKVIIVRNIRGKGWVFE